jgi:peptidoglycan hydrolase-like protein with peptidoglycan-binding domain
VPLLDAGLRAGSRGDGVVGVQQHLQRLGYYAGPANGEMDGPTDAAVRRFQQVAGVTGDPAGAVGRPTAVALLAGGDRPVLRVGAHSEDVHRLQHALAVALNRTLPPTGDFLSMTQQAVRDYQASRGLPVDGTVAAATWSALQQGR